MNQMIFKVPSNPYHSMILYIKNVLINYNYLLNFSEVVGSPDVSTSSISRFTPGFRPLKQG